MAIGGANHTSHPVILLIITISIIALGLWLNLYLTGDAGEYTIPAVVLIVPALGGMALSFESMEYELQEKVSTALMISAVVLLLFVSFYANTIIGVIAARVMSAVIVATVFSLFVIIPNTVVRWRFEERSPEERILSEE